MREGLRLVEEREQLHSLKLEALRRAIDIGVADLDEGRLTEYQADEISSLIAKLGNEAHESVSAL